MAGGKTIGTTLLNGFAGTYSRHPDMIVTTEPCVEANGIDFGLALQRGATGGVKLCTDTSKFCGVAARQVKQSYSLTEEGGRYEKDDAVSVFKRGAISVICKSGTPVINGAVEVDAAGNFVATGGTALTGVVWGSLPDANKVCDIILLSRVGA